MKRFLSLMGSILSLTILAILVIAVVTSLKSSASTFAPGGYPGPQTVRSSSQPTAYPGPSGNRNSSLSQESNQEFSVPLTPVLEEGSEEVVVLSSQSTGGVQFAELQEVVIHESEPQIMTLHHLDLDDNTLVGTTSVEDGVAVVKIDLETGQSEFLTPISSQGIEDITISENHIAWVEVASTKNDFSTQLLVYDLTQRTHTVLAQGLPRHPDIKGGILTWQEYHDDRWIIYGYDLTLAERFLIAEDMGKLLFPRVCSKEWMIYLKNIQEGQPGTADLYSSNLETGESILLGQVPFPNNAAPGRHHACDGNRVAWIGIDSVNNRNTGFEQHVYDLSTYADQTLNIAIHGLSFDVLISGDILISTTGYDLRQNIAFDPFPNIPTASRNGKLLLDDNRILWITQPLNESWQLYTASIVR